MRSRGARRFIRYGAGRVSFAARGASRVTLRTCRGTTGAIGEQQSAGDSRIREGRGRLRPREQWHHWRAAALLFPLDGPRSRHVPLSPATGRPRRRRANSRLGCRGRLERGRDAWTFGRVSEPFPRPGAVQPERGRDATRNGCALRHARAARARYSEGVLQTGTSHALTVGEGSLSSGLCVYRIEGEPFSDSGSVTFVKFGDRAWRVRCVQRYAFSLSKTRIRSPVPKGPW